MHCKSIQGSIEVKRRRGRPKMQWQDNIVKWTGLDINKAMRAAENREGWKKNIKKIIYCAPTAPKFYGICKKNVLKFIIDEMVNIYLKNFINMRLCNEY